ncbi:MULTISPECIES: DUF4034 domain-containing protein [Micromonospora]|uniref:DUF4034 domain-containing protein n=1 Tax=Micromonospora sp. HUAS YX12 TaxID=3156396 RepID=A0AAU7QXI4_9ACTN
MISTVWRLLTRQIDPNRAQDDAVLREACTQARYGSDIGPAKKALAATRDDYDRRARYVRVLAESTAGGLGSRIDRTTGRVDTAAAWTDRWASRAPADPDAQLVRARSLMARAWEVRGGGWAATVAPEQWAEFSRLLDLARQVNDLAMRLAPEDPTPWVNRLDLMIDESAPLDEFEEAWRELTKRDPWHQQGHVRRLVYHCRKWSGSHEAMFGFARSVAAAAPTGSPLLVLPVRAAAEWALWEQDREPEGGTADEISERWRQDPVMQSDLDNALSRWFHQPATRHADWLNDANYLAYGLARTGRDAEAAPVFASIGRYMTGVPWSWWGQGRGDTAFLRARRRARRAA